jgi:uncharacterized protein
VAGSPRSGARWVSLAQALVARELVEDLGVPTRRTAVLLGLAPSAVSQYVRGRRRAALLTEYGARPDLVAIAHRAAVALSETPKGRAPPARLLLEAATQIAERAGRSGSSPKAGASRAVVDRAVLRQLRERVAAEQAAVTACMTLAQKARDELTRAIFRQIASDSLRHAEIVASLAVYLEAGTSRSLASGIVRADIDGLLRREHEAEAEGGDGLRLGLGGVMKILAQSMADDEAKHERLLQGLLAEGLPE